MTEANTGTAIIGLGVMGRGMAKNILAAGIPLTGYDMAQPALDALKAMGGTPATSAAEAANGTSLLILMVVNAAQARAALFEQGAAAALSPGATVMLSSTVAPFAARAIGDELAEMGHHLLDAPVSGGQVGAEAGTLTIMASGSAQAFARAEKVLEATAGTLHRLGDEPGMGATYKVVHQLAAGVHIAAAAELMSFGAKAGCDPQKLHEIVMASAGASWMLGNRGPRMMEADPEVTSTVEIFIKDLGLVEETAKEAEAPVPLAALSLQLFSAARALGHGKADDALVIRAYEALTGKPVHES
ncbi:NAD(P)-dependent oxidoreductase [Vannielia litorea]|uniref:NAD(P)-dependent oxidoreductase n=1 Tax=Vannielia litorea TaxID=1217970 RepID=UPI001C986447|nr:NAD(P)-dependent oxidoreductase [Vannielia litorea]MBY6048821.1 NAD(P)-dependent oxidoreductase [Vannielia litorea]MBY6076235.1 NAD(P)-dependent oxidoreductase [Vannielia litorea]